MSKVTHTELGWAVLAQPTGEVLTADARSPGLHLGLLGVPPGFARRDAEGWLYDVMGVAHESSASQPVARPIPAILDHAMTGLLFSHGELWDRPGLPSPCSYAFVESRGEIGFGWVGDAKVSVWVDGHPRDPAWVILRDSRGHQARAWSIPAHHEVQVRISWSHWAGDPTAGGAEVEASWNAEGGPGSAGVIPYERPSVEAVSPAFLPLDLAPVPSHVSAADSPSDLALAPPPVDAQSVAAPEIAPAHEPIPVSVEPDATHDWVAEYEAEVARSSPGFWGRLRIAFSWLLGRRAEESAPKPPEAERTIEAEPTFASEPRIESERTVVQDPAPPAPPPAELIGEAPAPVEALPTEETVRIPPSPEPVELTTLAIGWVETDDPNVIDLPALEPVAPPPAEFAPPPPPPPPAVELEIVDVTLGEPPALAGIGPAPRRLEGLQHLAEATAGPLLESVSAEATAPWPTEEIETETEIEAAPNAEQMATPVAPALPEPATPVVALGPGSTVTVPPLRPAWPSTEELSRQRGFPGRRHGLWIALVGALFAGGWLIGALQDSGRARDGVRRGALSQALHAVGLGGPRFVVQVNSRPPGAWISVDGENLTLRTPAAIEVPPGEHTIGLSFTEFGAASFPVRGRKGDRVPLDAALWGALEVFSPDGVNVTAVSVDGVPRGLAPVRVDSLDPGVHEVRFTGLDVPSWGQTVDIRVGETRELLARAVQSPASGVLQIEASLTDALGTQPLKGAQVWIDGELRGSTPLTVDLPRGPHSVRLVHKGQEAPIQVIDLPGGNQRFAVFELGLDQDVPRLKVDVPSRIPRDRPAVLSATVVGIPAPEVREMWLHVRMAEGAWRRYALTVLKAPAGAAGVATFPTAAFDAQGRARYYVSAHSGQGDETFTEIRTITLETAPGSGR
jgi:PEGA domain-containing protein